MWSLSGINALRDLVVKYRINDPPPFGWDFVSIDFWEAEYGFVDYKGKKIMDIGADWGRTADYFLQKGAKAVVAVEGAPFFYETLKENAKLLPGIIPVFLLIRHPDDFVDLIKRWSPDLMQVDCEGCEAHLFQVPDEIFSRVPEYLIETHSQRQNLYKAMKEKCHANNYTIIEDRLGIGNSPYLRVLYAIAPQYIY